MERRQTRGFERSAGKGRDASRPTKIFRERLRLEARLLIAAEMEALRKQRRKIIRQSQARLPFADYVVLEILRGAHHDAGPAARGLEAFAADDLRLAVAGIEFHLPQQEAAGDGTEIHQRLQDQPGKPDAQIGDHTDEDQWREADAHAAEEPLVQHVTLIDHPVEPRIDASDEVSHPHRAALREVIKLVRENAGELPQTQSDCHQEPDGQRHPAAKKASRSAAKGGCGIHVAVDLDAAWLRCVDHGEHCRLAGYRWSASGIGPRKGLEDSVAIAVSQDVCSRKGIVNAPSPLGHSSGHESANWTLDAARIFAEGRGTMSVSISTIYSGGLRCESTHGPSQSKLLTDAPVDNMGKGEAYSPTDLVATALGTCMATTMGIYAQRNEIDLRGMSVAVEKEMTKEPPRRIAQLTVELRVPLAESHPHREALERAALTCPVAKSLHPDVQLPVRFLWAE